MARDVKRLVCQTTLGIGASQADLTLSEVLDFRSDSSCHLQRSHSWEGIVKASGLHWVIARPTAFIDGPATGVYQHGFMPGEKKPTLKISRADVAGFTLQQLNNSNCLCQTRGLTY